MINLKNNADPTSISHMETVLTSGWFAEIKQGDWWAEKVAFSIASIKSINCNMHGNFIISKNNSPIIHGCYCCFFIYYHAILRQLGRALCDCVFSLGSLWAPWERRSPRAPESSAQVRYDEEADDERHSAAQRAGICGAAGVTNCSGGQSLLVSLFPHFEDVFWLIAYCFNLLLNK